MVELHMTNTVRERFMIVKRFKIYFPVKDVSRSKETTIVEMNTKG